jgi:hypothetical protein
MIRVEFMIVVDISDDNNEGVVQIEASKPDLAALMIATEHMMNLMALESEAGYERAIELLVEGAKKARRVQ